MFLNFDGEKKMETSYLYKEKKPKDLEAAVVVWFLLVVSLEIKD